MITSEHLVEDARSTALPPSSRVPERHLGHELLFALTMGFALAVLAATTWLWTR